MAIKAFENWLVSPPSHSYIQIKNSNILYYLFIYYIFRQTRKCLERETTKRNDYLGPPTENKNYCNTGVFRLLLNKWEFFFCYNFYPNVYYFTITTRFQS